MDLILNASNKCVIFKHSQNTSHDILAFAKVLFFMEILKVVGCLKSESFTNTKYPLKILDKHGKTFRGCFTDLLYSESER